MLESRNDQKPISKALKSTLNILGSATCISAAALTQADSSAAVGLEEIVVTAQKRAESLQDVPIAVTAFSGDDMREQGIGDFQGISERTPGLLIGTFSPAQPEIAIRGVGTKEDGPGANDSTVVSIDDVYVAARIAQVIDIFDLERVEVLRGPQGTLYGRNSIAGSLNFVTPKPDEEFKLRLEQTFGSYDNYDTRVLVKGAIDEDRGLFGKISYSRRVHDGYVDLYSDAGIRNGTMNGIDRQSWRAQLRFAPNDQLDVILTVDGAKDDDEGQNREPIGDIIAAPNSVALNQTLGGAGDNYDSFSTEGFLERDVLGVSLKVEYHFDNVTFTSITAYRDAEVQTALDCCGLNGNLYPLTNYDYVDENAQQFTQEFRLSGDTETLQWVTGLFYTDETDHRLEGFGFGPIGDPTGSFDEIGASAAFSNISDVDADIEAWAIYGQGTYNLSDAMRVTLGLRYSAEEKNVVSSGSVTGGPPTGIVVGPFGPAKGSEDWNSTDFRVALDYDLTDTSLLYASVASGFKSGGFTGSPKTVATATTPFDEENVLNYEMGFKSTLLDNTLRFNAAVFLTDYEDLQVTRFATTPATPAFGEFLTENAGEAEIKGIELETTWVPTEHLELSFNWAYLDAEYTDFSGLTPAADGTPIDFSGNTMRQAPEHSGSINARYTWDSVVDSNDQLAVNLSARYVDDVFYDPDNNPRAVVDAYTVADARLSYTSANEKIRVDLWINNLTDEEYTTHAFSLTGGQRAFANVGKPRWYGLTLTYEL